MGDADVILAFVKSVAALGRELPALAREMQAGRTLWLIWPKKSSALAGNLGEPKSAKWAWRPAWWITKYAPWMRPGADWRLPCEEPSAPPGERRPRANKKNRSQAPGPGNGSRCYCCVRFLVSISGPWPPGMGAGFFSGMSATMASVVSIREAMEEAFWSAVRVTLVGSITPATTRSS